MSRPCGQVRLLGEDLPGRMAGAGLPVPGAQESFRNAAETGLASLGGAAVSLLLHARVFRKSSETRGLRKRPIPVNSSHHRGIDGAAAGARGRGRERQKEAGPGPAWGEQLFEWPHFLGWPSGTPSFSLSNDCYTDGAGCLGGYPHSPLPFFRLTSPSHHRNSYSVSHTPQT